MQQGRQSAKQVRSAARALIVRDGHLLAVKMQRPGGSVFHILPGGGQMHGETLVESLQRECEEEIGVRPVVGQVAYVREYIGGHHIFAKHHREFHQLEVVFNCTIPNSRLDFEGCETDRHQIGVCWLPLAQLESMNFFPRILAEYVQGDSIYVPHAYLGDIN